MRHFCGQLCPWEGYKKSLAQELSAERYLGRPRKRASDDENEYNLFMGNEVSNISSSNIFFFLTFLEKMGQKNFGGHDHFLEEGVILR